MRPTFILYRMFAISALFVGAAQVSYAAPIAETREPSAVVSPGVEAVAALVVDVPVEIRAPVENSDVSRRIEEVVDPPPEPAVQDIEGRTCPYVAMCRRD